MRPVDGSAADTSLAAGTHRAGRRPWQACLGWGFLVALIVVQFVLFRRHALREVVWAYPDHYDQAYYLQQTYTLYERMRAVGCWSALVEHVGTPRPQGILFPVPAALLFLLTGPSRLAALAVGFAYFSLFQAALFGTLRWLTRRWAAAFLGLGLLLAALSPFLANGGLTDYRIDFTAMCLFGLVLCLVVRSRLFASRGWSAAAGAACSWLLLCRYLTAAYLTGVFGLVLLFLLVRRWRHRTEPELRPLANRQLVGLALAGAVVLGLCLPPLWHSREALYKYYVVGHVTGAEKAIFVLAANIKTTVEQLLFYPQSVAIRHLGETFLGLTTILLGTASLLGLVRVLSRARPGHSDRLDWAGTAFGLACSLLVPYALLTLDEAKSEMACNILVPPTVWLILLPVAWVSRARQGESRPGLRAAGVAALAAVAFAGGLFTQVNQYLAPGYFTQHRRDVVAISRLFDRVAEHCRAASCRTPRVSVTSLQSDYLAPVVIPPFVYERHRLLLLPREGKLGSTAFGVTAEEAIEDVRQSDVVILAGTTGVPSPFPFDECMKGLYPQLEQFCEETLTPLGRFCIFGQDVRVYGRPRPETGTAAPAPD
jgi:hypothetical protein